MSRALGDIVTRGDVMAPNTAPEERDPHSKRIVMDATIWHERLELLAEMRRCVSSSDRSSFADHDQGHAAPGAEQNQSSLLRPSNTSQKYARKEE
jgi:hypothetical protein